MHITDNIKFNINKPGNLRIT